MRTCWIAALVLAHATGSAQAADATFERDWHAASNGASHIAGPYQVRLQAYFDTHPGYRACDLHLKPGTGVRMLLRFDAAGGFSTQGEATNPHMKRGRGD